MSDRRRLNGHPGGTQPVQFLLPRVEIEQPKRERQPNELRRFVCDQSALMKHATDH